MATKRMLIDASHPEETRVLIVNKNKLEDFDVEFEARRPLKGNIYLAKVTRVEPSLQAAFVDFGGNRHGFLAFSEIHPDYYQIPVADREALIAEARAEADAAHTEDDEETLSEDKNVVETLGGDDIEEIEARRPIKHRRKYKIQEVIKRRQILLVQAVKEERGTKGAALTTFLSLAGRYCVLMPNTDRGGGISRKIGNISDRKRLKSVVSDLGISEGMAVIVRTAGAKRSKAEIRRDYDYLLRLWNQVREMTLNSIAPCLVHEEGNLIKRSIRDLYEKEIDEIIVHGEDGYRMAKDFMKVLIPSHAKKVQRYKDDGIPMTRGYDIEQQLTTIHSPEVHMKSGAYIVINPTEALVSIDVNSGRSTKERNIEETALRTNLESAEEIARQLRLRDLAGLIVIDFIDMEHHRNQVKVERALKDAMQPDRARIQIGRISPFGLLELSRQRLRPSLIETSSEPCPYCEGTGIRRSTDTTALEVIRAIEDEGMRKPQGGLKIFAPTSVSLFVLNNKRQTLAEIEEKFSLSVVFESDDTLIPPAIRIERDGEGDVTQKAKHADSQNTDTIEEIGNKRRRRRRGRRRGRRDGLENNFDGELETVTGDGVEATETVATSSIESDHSPNPAEEEDQESNSRRRRGRRGGRKRRVRENEDSGTPKLDSQETDTLINTKQSVGGVEPSESKLEATSSLDESLEKIEPVTTSELSTRRLGKSSDKSAGDQPDLPVRADSADLDKLKAVKPRRKYRKPPSNKADASNDSDGNKSKQRKTLNNDRDGSALGDGGLAPIERSSKSAPDQKTQRKKEKSVVPVTSEVLKRPEDTPELVTQDIKINSSHPKDHEKTDTVVVNVGDENVENPNPRRGWWQRS